MPYYPALNPEATTFPTFGKDLQFQLNLIKQQYARFHPSIDYYPLQKSRVNVTDVSQIERETGKTAFDPLYGEAVDPAMSGGAWVQPHGTDNLSADVDTADIFGAARRFPAKVQRGATDKARKSWGFTKIKDYVVSIPLITLDEHATTVGEGDKLVFGGVDLNVDEFVLSRDFANTNYKLYAVLNCAVRLKGA